MSASFNEVYMSDPINYLFKEYGLSYRESEVASLVSKGLANKDVSGKLNITEKTVKFHLTNIYKKTRVKSRAQLCVLAANKAAGEPMIVGGDVR